MVNVYIRRKKNFVLFYSRRRRGFETQGPSSPPFCKDSASIKEIVQNNGLFSNVSDFTDIGFVEGIPIPCISELSHENAELEFEINAAITTIKLENGSVLDTQESLPQDVLEKDRIPIDIGLVNNESLLTVIQQLTSSFRFSRRPRSARKPTSSASRKWSRFGYSASDDSKQVSHFGESTSVCCKVIPRTPIKEDKISKITSRSLVSDVHSLLSTGVLEGAPVKYMKDNVELSGIVTTSGLYCGCSLCNFKEVVSSLKFEKHAGSKSHNQNAHIFLETGISLYALSKELKNVSLESLRKMIAEKFGYPTIMEVYKAWEGNTNLYLNKGESSNQKIFPDLIDQLQANLNFPKGRRSTRAKKPPFSATSKVNQKVSRQLTFCDVDPQHPPAHKKRGVDILSFMELSSKKPSEISSSDAYESNIREFISQNVKDLDIGKKKAIVLAKYTPDSLLSTVSCLLATGLLDGIMVNYKKDEIDLRGIIKDIGICCGCESCRFSKVLSSLDFGKHGGGDASGDPNAYIFVNNTITLYSLVRELGNVPLGLLSCELIQKMIGCLPNIVCFLAWKESFHDKKSNPRRTSGDDLKNQLAHVFPHSKPSAAERLRRSGSEDNLPLLSGEDVKVDLPRKAEKTMKHKEQDFHQQIFHLLNDGSKLSYRSHGEDVLTGYKFGKNILCSCCNLMLSASKFEAHAGHEKRRKPYHSIYTSYRKSLNQIAMLLLLDAPSINPINVLIPNCPTDEQSPSHASSSFRFHSRRFLAPCNLCSCMLCRNGEATLNFGNICGSTMLFCGQCGGMFHVDCLRNHGICDFVGRPCPSDIWLCGDKCKKVHTDLLDFLQEGSMIITESLLNLLRSRSVGSTFDEETKFDVHWQLLSGRFHGGKSKSLLQQATTVFQDAFGAVYKRHRDVLSTMVNGEKGVAEFFGGMFCAVLTIKSIIVSAALLRVFDNRVAELLLAATPKERRGRGYFKILLWKIEEMLRLMKVENLIVAADEHSLPMWIEKFGFLKLSGNQIQEYEMNHRILRFENTTMLQKLVPSAADILT